MSGQMWEVVGGADKGGIVVREGQDLKSKEVPSRLATGTIIKEVSLAGERLQYERVSGMGPAKGWVSLKFKGSDLVVKTDKAATAKPAPIVMMFYSGGMTAPQGRGQLKPGMNVITKEGLTDFVVGDHIGEEGYADCADFDDYTNRLAQKIDEDPKNHGRPVIIIAHSHGTVPAWGTAKKLGDRCLKLYVLTRRAPNGDLLDETWGVDSHEKVAEIDECKMLKEMLEAWPNAFLDEHKNSNPLPPAIKACMDVIKRQYSSHVYPCGTADVATICGEDQAIKAPIMALAAEKEARPKGEHADKMQGWKDFTQGDFEVVVVPGVDHMGIMGAMSPSWPTIIKDMKMQMAK